MIRLTQLVSLCSWYPRLILIRVSSFLFRHLNFLLFTNVNRVQVFFTIEHRPRVNTPCNLRHAKHFLTIQSLLSLSSPLVHARFLYLFHTVVYSFALCIPICVALTVYLNGDCDIFSFKYHIDGG